MNIVITLPHTSWVNIASGKKCVEIRKIIPRNFVKRHDRCYVVIKDTDILAGYFTIDGFTKFESKFYPTKVLANAAAIPISWLKQYIANTTHFYGWFIGRVVEYKSWQIATDVLHIKHNPQAYTYTTIQHDAPRKRLW